MNDKQNAPKGLIETQRLVDEIRVFLQAMDRTSSPRLQLLSEQYAAALRGCERPAQPVFLLP